MLRCRCVVMHITKHLFIKIHFNKMSIFYIVFDCGSLWMMTYSGNSHISSKYCGITGCIVPIDQEIYCCYLCPSVLFLVETFFWWYVHVTCMFHSNYVCIKFVVCFAKKHIIKKYVNILKKTLIIVKLKAWFYLQKKKNSFPLGIRFWSLWRTLQLTKKFQNQNSVNYCPSYNSGSLTVFNTLITCKYID